MKRPLCAGDEIICATRPGERWYVDGRVNTGIAVKKFVGLFDDAEGAIIPWEQLPEWRVQVPNDAGKSLYNRFGQPIYALEVAA